MKPVCFLHFVLILEWIRHSCITFHGALVVITCSPVIQFNLHINRITCLFLLTFICLEISELGICNKLIIFELTMLPTYSRLLTAYYYHQMVIKNALMEVFSTFVCILSSYAITNESNSVSLTLFHSKCNYENLTLY